MGQTEIFDGDSSSRPRRLMVLTRDRSGPSFRQRIAPYLTPLARRGIESEVVELARSPWRRMRQLARSRQFDGILLHKKTLSLAYAWLLSRTAGKVIYDFDDAIMYKARDADSGPNSGRLRRFRRTVALADLVIAGNSVLADHARRCGARQVGVVATGLNAGRYTPRTDYGISGKVRLVWIGSRSTLKQLRPFRATFEAIGRAVPNAILRIIADASLDLPSLKIEHVPWSLEAESRLLAECDIGIAPLPDTPFTRGKCGFKVLQYMAAALPVVTSPVGANAEYVLPTQTGLWAKSTEQWIDALHRLAADEELRKRLGQEGLKRIREEFDFTVLTSSVCDLIGQCLNQTESRALNSQD